MSDVNHIDREVGALQAALRSVPITDCSSDELKRLTTSVRSTQRCLDGLLTRIGIASDRLAAEGRSGSASEVLLDGGSVSGSTARRDATRAKASAEVPRLVEAMVDGSISGDHVDSIARYTTKLTDTERAAIDFDRLVDTASKLPAGTFDAHVKRRVEEAKSDHGLSDAVAKRKASEFRHWYDHKSGMGKFSGQLDPQRYEALTGAIDAHVSSIAAQTGRDAVSKDAATAAQALVELATSAQPSDGSSRRRPLINIVVDHDTVVHGAHANSIRQTGNGHNIAPETIARLCCDAVVRKTVLDENGVPIQVGRKYRTATDAQWSAIRSIYSTCAWDGCERPLSWCQLHHILEWENGGPTDLDNLIPLCSTHHHQVHEGQWSVKLRTKGDVATANRSLQIFKPDKGSGPELYATTRPPSRKPPNDTHLTGKPKTTRRPSDNQLRRRPSRTPPPDPQPSINNPTNKRAARGPTRPNRRAQESDDPGNLVKLQT